MVFQRFLSQQDLKAVSRVIFYLDFSSFSLSILPSLATHKNWYDFYYGTKLSIVFYCIYEMWYFYFCFCCFPTKGVFWIFSTIVLKNLSGLLQLFTLIDFSINIGNVLLAFIMVRKRSGHLKDIWLFSTKQCLNSICILLFLKGTTLKSPPRIQCKKNFSW